MTYSLPACGVAAMLLVLLTTSGCVSQKEGGSRERSAGPRAAASSPLYVEMDLAAAEGSVKSIQLYRGSDETRLPVAELGSSNRLTLEFDLMTERGRPLSVYFYHADRTWRRDLSPGEYLASFQSDDVLDYEISRGTDVPYVHYAYDFPNSDIQFLLSGNYVLRVAEQGNEEEVLFERPFFVTEQSTALEFGTDRVLVGDYGYPSIQPIARFRPPSDGAGNAFDYTVCFVRNGRFELARCSDQPSLANSPFLQFYLEPEVAFEPEEPPYFLDLTDLRSSDRIVSADFSARPYRIELEPDYAQFSGRAGAPMLRGQSRISSVVRLGNADTEAEYVRARVAYVPPDEQEMGDQVLLTGSFNGWRYDREHTLRWAAERGRYEGEILLKQGEYEYRYVGRDRRLSQAVRSNMPQIRNQYTTLVYYRDTSRSTDRLVAVRQALSE
ncbi:MAG: type IX secretion system plug protein domain-containing protein [Rhodothermales bacterium]